MKTIIIKYEVSEQIETPGGIRFYFCLTPCPYHEAAMVGGGGCTGIKKWGKPPCQYMVANDKKERTVTCCHPDIEKE